MVTRRRLAAMREEAVEHGTFHAALMELHQERHPDHEELNEEPQADEEGLVLPRHRRTLHDSGDVPQDSEEGDNEKELSNPTETTHDEPRGNVAIGYRP